MLPARKPPPSSPSGGRTPRTTSASTPSRRRGPPSRRTHRHAPHMPTVVTHAVVAAGLYRLVAGPTDGSRWGIVAAGALAMLPDADVVGWRLVERDSLLGHRGLTHSVLFAVVVGAVAAWAL